MKAPSPVGGRPRPLRTPRRRGLRRLGAALTALAAASALSSCGISNGPDSVAHKSTLVVGVKADQPGLGLEKKDGTFEGFDVDVAGYVARKLGAQKVIFKAITSGERETWLQNGTVDLVVATYSITPVRKTKVLFAGPYYLAHQDTLVRTEDYDTIRSVHDLKGKKLCNVPGSNSFNRVYTEKRIPAISVPGDTYQACIDELAAGRLQAVSTDDLILAGFVREHEGAMRLVNNPFSDEKYGIGIKQGDVEGCEDINKAITDMYQQGVAADLLDKWFRASQLQTVKSVPQFEGCS
jgi:glutamate transport system substrate-binding protein